MTTPRPGEGGSGEGTPGDSRRPAAAWVKACRHLPMFEKLGEAHESQIIYATKGSISHTWKRRGSWGPASPTRAFGGCTGHAGRQTSQTEVAHAGANQARSKTLRGTRASGQSSASKHGRQRMMSQMRPCQWSTVWPSRQQMSLRSKMWTRNCSISAFRQQW